MKPDEVLNFQEYWKAYGYSGDNGEMSARRAFTFAQLQTHRQYLSLQREVEKLRKQVAAQPMRALDLPSASAGCKCFVSIESYNACPVHGTANQ